MGTERPLPSEMPESLEELLVETVTRQRLAIEGALERLDPLKCECCRVAAQLLTVPPANRRKPWVRKPRPIRPRAESPAPSSTPEEERPHHEG